MKNFDKVKYTFWATGTITLLTFVGFIIALCKDKDSSWTTGLGVVTGVVATIALGFWIQRINDKRFLNAKLERRSDLRKRLIGAGMASYAILDNIRDNELHLVNMLGDLKNSFVGNNIDFDNLTFNYYVFSHIYKNIGDFFTGSAQKEFQDSYFTLFFNDDPEDRLNSSKYNYEQLQNECAELFEKMNYLKMLETEDFFTENEKVFAFSFKNKSLRFDETTPVFSIIVALQSMDLFCKSQGEENLIMIKGLYATSLISPFGNILNAKATDLEEQYLDRVNNYLKKHKNDE